MCHTSQCIEGFFEHHIFLIDILKIENLRSNRDQPAESTYKTWTCLIFQDETKSFTQTYTLPLSSVPFTLLLVLF